MIAVKLFVVGLLVTGSALASGPYYEQLFEDDRLDVTIALSFRQVQVDLPIPVLGPAARLAEFVLPDEKRLATDVLDFEHEILNCRECAFEQTTRTTGYHFYRGKFAYQGRPIQVNLKLIFPERGIQTSWLKELFTHALRNDDVVIYSGHSRYGSGFPDFFAPFSNTGKVFINDPLRGWMGFEKGYFARNKYQILTLISCKTSHYYREVLRSRVWEKAPSSLALILTEDDTFLEDDPKIAIALVRSLVMQLSKEQVEGWMENSALLYHADYLGENGGQNRNPLLRFDGFFDDSYKGRPRPERVVPPRVDRIISP